MPRIFIIAKLNILFDFYTINAYITPMCTEVEPFTIKRVNSEQAAQIKKGLAESLTATTESDPHLIYTQLSRIMLSLKQNDLLPEVKAFQGTAPKDFHTTTIRGVVVISSDQDGRQVIMTVDDPLTIRRFPKELKNSPPLPYLDQGKKLSAEEVLELTPQALEAVRKVLTE